MTERELLRIHIEACWGISVPPLTSATVDLTAYTTLLPWSLYCAQLSQEEVTLWRPDVSSEQRASLLQQARNTGASFNTITGMRREVVLLEPATSPASPTTPPAPYPQMPQAPETQPIVRILTAVLATYRYSRASTARSARLTCNHSTSPIAGVVYLDGASPCYTGSRGLTVSCSCGVVGVGGGMRSAGPCAESSILRLRRTSI